MVEAGNKGRYGYLMDAGIKLFRNYGGSVGVNRNLLHQYVYTTHILTPILFCYAALNYYYSF